MFRPSGIKADINSTLEELVDFDIIDFKAMQSLQNLSFELDLSEILKNAARYAGLTIYNFQGVFLFFPNIPLPFIMLRQAKSYTQQGKTLLAELHEDRKALAATLFYGPQGYLASAALKFRALDKDYYQLIKYHIMQSARQEQDPLSRFCSAADIFSRTDPVESFDYSYKTGLFEIHDFSYQNKNYSVQNIIGQCSQNKGPFSRAAYAQVWDGESIRYVVLRITQRHVPGLEILGNVHTQCNESFTC